MSRKPNITLWEGFVDRVIYLEGSLVVMCRGGEFRFNTGGITFLRGGTTVTDGTPVYPLGTAARK
jgi:hypothetical protein